MLKVTTLTFTLIAALSFGATTAQAGHFSGNRAPQPTNVSQTFCTTGYVIGSNCTPVPPSGPGFGFGTGGSTPTCTIHHHFNCTPAGSTIPDCKGGSQTIYGTTHECL